MICDNCLHKEVCGCEGAFDESLTYCKDFLSVSTEKTGYWIDTGSGQKCSKCHEIQYGYDNHRLYCANCGSRNMSNISVDVLDKIRGEVLEYIDDSDIAYEICGVFDKYKAESKEEIK